MQIALSMSSETRVSKFPEKAQSDIIKLNI